MVLVHYWFNLKLDTPICVSYKNNLGEEEANEMMRSWKPWFIDRNHTFECTYIVTEIISTFVFNIFGQWILKTADAISKIE